MDPMQIKEHMEVIGSDGGHIGTVDKVEGGRIKLTKNDSGGHNHHHYIPTNWVSRAEGVVELNKTADEARQQWEAEA